jgi:2-dehydro-3-deoxygluconokinase
VEVCVPRFVSVGEAIVELSGDVERGYRFSYQGHALAMAREMRVRLDASWTVDFFTALGDDIYSQKLVDDLAAHGIGIGTILKMPDRAIGLSIVGDAGDNGRLVTNWRSQAAARLMAEDSAALAEAFAGSNLIYVSGAAFAILLPRARGRLLKALHRARLSGSLIVLAPHEWPEQWTSRRVRGSAINAIATVADIVLTDAGAERATFGDASDEAIVGRYRDWGAKEVLSREGLNSDYVAAAARDASSKESAVADSRNSESR